MSFQNDTIKIGEVIISTNKSGDDDAGYKKITVDSLVLRNYSHGTLGELLSVNSGIFIKSYGMGGTASPSFRGTGANHTLIEWNGINLNHPMLGQSDLSLIPAAMADEINIYFGGASMSLNSGGIGGIINLETKPVWEKKTQIDVSPGLGSFGHYSGLVKIRSGNVHIQTVTKYYLQSSENDFRYLNTAISSEPVWETRTNSQVRQQGFIQELYYRKSKNTLSARIWYQSAHRNLPSTMLTQQVNSGEKQSDESLRSIFNYDIRDGNMNYFMTGALMLTRLNYVNRQASIDSRNLSETIIMKAGAESRIDEHTQLKVMLNEELNVIKSNNYDHKATRNLATFSVIAERNFSTRFGTSFLIREIVDNNHLLVPDFSTGMQFRLIDEKEYFLKANISRNSKTPALNDLFWLPGGNPDLKNEYAFIYELSYLMCRKISPLIILKYDLTLFRNNVKDMIQWHPGEYSYWTADNIQNVNSTGLESNLNLNYSISNFKSALNLGYSFTKATTAGSKDDADNTKGRQLIYMPENQVNASFTLNYKSVYSSWVADFTGKRYITVENSRYLPGYFINSIATGIKFDLHGNSLDMNLSIDNLFNVRYQTIAYYPLPGRSYFFKIAIQLLK
jgi:outer membrane cobalamin receptor